jgi:hypothetical protein
MYYIGCLSPELHTLLCFQSMLPVPPLILLRPLNADFVLALLQILHRDPGMERGGIKAMNLTADSYFMTVRGGRGKGRA